MALSKNEREFHKAEQKTIAAITRIFEGAFQVATLTNPNRINLAREYRRPITTKKIRKQLESIFYLGDLHATDLIKQHGAAAGETYLLDEMTQYVVNSLAFIGDDVRGDLIATLHEGYSEGESIPALRKRIQEITDLNKPRAVNLARTMTNEVYNQAHFKRYKESSVLEYIQFSAHLDDRTSPICRMLNQTIWHKDSPEVMRPPLHFHCRSRIIPYFSPVPGERDYTKWTDGTEIPMETVTKLLDQNTLFRTKYWNIPLTEVVKTPA